MAVGGSFGFILDNLLPGTKQERGIIKWKKSFSDEGEATEVASIHVYDPPFIASLSKKNICRYIPFLPYHGDNTQDHRISNTDTDTDVEMSPM